MAQSEYLPVYKPGQAITYNTSADVKAGQIVELTGPMTIAPAAADSTKAVGVAAWDAKAGQQVTVHSDGVQEVTASTAVTAGDRVGFAANGQAKVGTGFGTALTTAAAGALVRVKTII